MIKKSKKITFNKGGTGSKSGRVIIPAPYLEILNITDSEPYVDISLQQNKIVLMKATEEEKTDIWIELKSYILEKLSQQIDDEEKLIYNKILAKMVELEI